LGRNLPFSIAQANFFTASVDGLQELTERGRSLKAALALKSDRLFDQVTNQASRLAIALKCDNLSVKLSTGKIDELC
jgi:hypothetical protein